jgi:hypothetical protein
MMGFHGMSYGDAVTACAGAPAVVPGYFNAWPIKKGNFIEGASLPIKGVADDPCGDMFTSFFGTGWYPLQSYCEQRFLKNQMRDCSNPLDCVGSRDYCWAMPPFGTGGFAPVASPDGKFWTPDLVWSVDFNFASPTASGNGYNYPSPGFKASLALNVTGNSTSGSGTLKFYYTRTRVACNSSSISTVVASGGTATVMGTCTSGATFTATVTDDNKMGITLSTGYTQSLAPVTGDYTVSN